MQKENKQLKEALSSGIQKMNLELSETIQTKILDYLELLQKWNAIHNLTAVRDPLEMIYRHVLDSLVLLPALSKQQAFSSGTPSTPRELNNSTPSIIDVGTGAGIPGIFLAICLPDHSVFMLDSNQKKINFVQHVILSLKLNNATAICDRVENFEPKQSFDWVVSRAFASLTDFIRLSQHLCKPGGKLLAMKGAVTEDEIKGVQDLNFADTSVILERIEPVSVPNVVGARSLVFITVQRRTPCQPK